MRNNRMALLAGMLTFGLIAAGCSKQNDTPAPGGSPVEAATQPGAAAAPSPQAPVTIEVNAQLQDLQLQVDAYEKIHKRKPASLDQLVRDGFLTRLPPAPPGKRFAYDPASGRVSLAP